MFKNSNKIFLGLLLLCIYSFFVFNSYLHITDTVESNYALTAKEMVLSGDWMSPRIYGHFWYDKPVFFYWQIASAFKMFGFHEFAARFWSAVMGIFSLLLMLWFGSKLFPGQSVGLTGALILGTSFEFWMIAKFIITDMTLFFFFNGALACFLLAYRGGLREKNYYYLFYIFCGLATLTKGPIGFLLPGLIVLVFLCWTRNGSELKQMKIIPGILLFLAVTIPWYLGMYLQHGRAFILNFFGVHNYLRATVSEHPKDNVFYYYFFILLVGFFPWIAFLPQTIKNLWPKGKGLHHGDSDTKFLIAWIVVVFMFFQSIATKYPTYTFAILFPLSLLTARFFEMRREMPAKKLIGSGFVIFLFTALFLGAAYFIYRSQDSSWVSLLPVVLLTLIGFVICLYFVLAKSTQKFLMIFLAIILIFNIVVVKTLLIPMSQYKSGKTISSSLRRIYRSGDLITSFGTYQTSAVFYSGYKIYDLIHRAGFKNQSFSNLSWASKYVMPSLRWEDVLRSRAKRVFVIMHQKDYQKFMKEYPVPWKIVRSTESDYLLQRIDQ